MLACNNEQIKDTYYLECFYIIQVLTSKFMLI